MNLITFHVEKDATNFSTEVTTSGFGKEMRPARSELLLSRVIENE